MIASSIGMGPAGTPRPALVVVSGAVDDAATESRLERAFGDLRPATLDDLDRAPGPAVVQRVRLPKPYAQGAIGYLVTAAPPSMRQALAWQMLLYVLAHDYSGRLGRSAIGDKGLTYYIDGSYRTNGRKSWIVIKSGVDPDKADAFTEELRQQLARLASDPPTDAEVDAARRHILGRDISAAQSNDELAAKLVRQFVETGARRSHAQLEADVRSISRNDVLALITSFTSGTIFRVDVQPQGSK
jgi:predicted Zn-dependent peptidase